MTENYIKSLQGKPKYPQYQDYHWADYIELLCLANLDGEISKMDILDRLAEREDDLEEGFADDIEEMDNLDEEGLEMSSQRYRRYDKWMERIGSWFEILASREQLYGQEYPFVVIDNDLVSDYDLNNQKHKYYLFLLFCSKLYLFDNTTSNMLSSYYEVFSFDGLKQFLPSSFCVELFGTNELNESPEFGKGVTCLNKIKNLAKRLNENLVNGFKEDVYPDNNFGDAGLDLIAYAVTGDRQPSNITLLGQCACTTQWVDKQSSSSFESWSSKINLTTVTINTVFIPFCYRDARGDWFDRSKIRKSFIIDRSRLVRFMQVTHPFSVEINEVLDAVIAAREEVI